jgi:hypothetical protein
MWVWMSWIKLDMVELRYVRSKLGRLRWGRLDTIEDLIKTVDVFDKSISGGKADLIFQNVRCKEHIRNLCVFRDGIYISKLDVGYHGYLGNLSWLRHGDHGSVFAIVTMVSVMAIHHHTGDSCKLLSNWVGIPGISKPVTSAG